MTLSYPTPGPTSDDTLRDAAARLPIDSSVKLLCGSGYRMRASPARWDGVFMFADVESTETRLSPARRAVRDRQTDGRLDMIMSLISPAAGRRALWPV